MTPRKVTPWPSPQSLLERVLDLDRRIEGENDSDAEILLPAAEWRAIADAAAREGTRSVSTGLVSLAQLEITAWDSSREFKGGGKRVRVLVDGEGFVLNDGDALALAQILRAEVGKLGTIVSALSAINSPDEKFEPVPPPKKKPKKAKVTSSSLPQTPSPKTREQKAEERRIDPACQRRAALARRDGLISVCWVCGARLGDDHGGLSRDSDGVTRCHECAGWLPVEAAPPKKKRKPQDAPRELDSQVTLDESIASAGGAA